MQYAILQYDIYPALGGVQGNQTAAGDGTQASRLRDSSLPTAAGETPAYQRDSSLPTAAGETPAYQRESSLPTAAGETPAYQRESNQPSAAGEINGTQASRLRDSSQPTAAGETPAYQRDSSLPTAAGENLHCELLAFANDMGIKLVRHDLPDGCKDFADHWMQQSVNRTPVPC